MKVGWIWKLFIYFLIVTFSGPFFDNWTTTEKFLFLSDAYAGKCKPSELVGPPTETFRCEEQQLAVNGLLSYARMAEFLSSVVIGISVDRFGPRIVAVLGVLLCIASWAFMCLLPKSGIMLKLSMFVIGVSMNSTLFPALTIERYTKRYKAQVLIFIGSSSSITCLLMKLLELVVVKTGVSPMTAGVYFILLLLIPSLICSYLFFPGDLKKDVYRIGQKNAYIYPTLREPIGSKGSETSNLSIRPPDTNLLVRSSSEDQAEAEVETGNAKSYYAEDLDEGMNEANDQNAAESVKQKETNVVYDSDKAYESQPVSKFNKLRQEDECPDSKDHETLGVLTKRNSYEGDDQVELTNDNVLDEPNHHPVISNLSISKWASGRLSSKWELGASVSLEKAVFAKGWTWRCFFKNLKSFEVILSVLYFCLNVVSLTYLQQSYDILYSHSDFLLLFLEYVLPFSFIPCLLFMIFAKFFTAFTLLLTVGTIWLMLNVCSLFQSYPAGILTAILLTVTYSIFNTHVYIYLESRVDKDYYASVIGFLNTVAGLSLIVNMLAISPMTDRKTILNINIAMLMLRVFFLSLFIYRHMSKWLRKWKADNRIVTP
ncbi:major facilitator superfamily MFS-1 protein [Theileria orientalis]|uniref:Major facilitator superfamily MFS-1 protein n=1 Tax=Theileria orientalis TaxID=68886 RepID=A0A976QSM2_THEOR|nr:major facilitator superfamily MFS-1 protein [Theileria orientalis]